MTDQKLETPEEFAARIWGNMQGESWQDRCATLIRARDRAVALALLDRIESELQGENDVGGILYWEILDDFRKEYGADE